VTVDGVVESKITGEERCPTEPPKERNNRFVQRSGTGNLAAHLDNSNAPTPETLTLTGRDVFIENDHEPVIRFWPVNVVTNASLAR
jgi:hypothetical protein